MLCEMEVAWGVLLHALAYMYFAQYVMHKQIAYLLVHVRSHSWSGDLHLSLLISCKADSHSLRLLQANNETQTITTACQRILESYNRYRLRYCTST